MTLAAALAWLAGHWPTLFGIGISIGVGIGVIKRYVLPVAQGLYAAFVGPRDEAKSQTERADMWREFSALNSKLDNLLSQNGQLSERVAIVESETRQHRGDIGRIKDMVKTLSGRITNVEERCNMTHRRSEIAVDLEGEGNEP